MRRLLLPLLPVLLATAACHGAPSEPDDRPKSSTSDAADAELDAWVGDLCTADKPMKAVSLANMAAPPIPENATEADREPIQTFLRKALDDIGKTRKKLAALPQAPTPAGRKLLKSYRKDVDKLRSTLFDYAENVEGFPAESLDAPYTLARLKLTTFKGMPTPKNAALTAAFRHAPECRYGRG